MPRSLGLWSVHPGAYRGMSGPHLVDEVLPRAVVEVGRQDPAPLRVEGHDAGSR